MQPSRYVCKVICRYPILHMHGLHPKCLVIPRHHLEGQGKLLTGLGSQNMCVGVATCTWTPGASKELRDSVSEAQSRGVCPRGESPAAVGGTGQLVDVYVPIMNGLADFIFDNAESYAGRVSWCETVVSSDYEFHVHSSEPWRRCTEVLADELLKPGGLARSAAHIQSWR